MAGDEDEMEVNGMEHTASEVVHEEGVHIQDVAILLLSVDVNAPTVKSMINRNK